MGNFPAQILPKHFDDVQLGRIGWQWHNLDPVCILFQNGLGFLTPMNNVVVNHQANFRARITGFWAILCDDLLDQSKKTIAVHAVADPISQATRQEMHGAKAIAFDILTGCEDFTLTTPVCPAANDPRQQIEINFIFVQQDHFAFSRQSLR